MAKARKISPALIEKPPLSKAAQMALTSLRLEGIILSDENLADFELVDAGKLSKQEAIARVLARVQK